VRQIDGQGNNRRREMPQIIVAADHGAAFGEGVVTLREGVTVADFESEHFATQLVERLGWAVEDADQLEQDPDAADSSAETSHSVGGECAGDREPAIAR
jgi:hypothetical protein